MTGENKRTIAREKNKNENEEELVRASYHMGDARIDCRGSFEFNGKKDPVLHFIIAGHRYPGAQVQMHDTVVACGCFHPRIPAAVLQSGTRVA